MEEVSHWKFFDQDGVYRSVLYNATAAEAERWRQTEQQVLRLFRGMPAAVLSAVEVPLHGIRAPRE